MEKKNEINLLFENFIEEIQQILAGSFKNEEKLTAVCRYLRDEIPHYYWVGFYLVDPRQDKVLILGPFAGDPTEHVQIAFGEGICGQAADQKETFIVQDVSKESNYLSCSASVQSEIVVPILKNDEIIGELDIDSHVYSPFTEHDKTFLEKVCEMVVDYV